MKRLLAISLALAAGISGLCAQPAPFDMSPERPDVTDAQPIGEPAVPADPAPPVTEEAASPSGPAPSADIRRRLMPAGSITLAGENAARSWGFHLTAAQAASPATLHVGYRNAVVVAPESSRMQVLVNQIVVMDEPVRSADGFSQIAVDVPPDLLHAGRNEITVRARQRHRTDCTVQSTYELWTEVDSARTWLSFSDPAAATYSGLGDLRALSADAQGRTRIAIVAPAIEHGDIGGDVLRLAQAIALHASMPNLDFSVVTSPAQADAGAALRVYLGSADDLVAVGSLPAAVSSGPVAAFMSDTDDGVPVFLVSGRSRADWLSAIDMILQPVDRPEAGMRDALVTGLWRLPDAPMIYGSRGLSLAELGVWSEQFSGRRYQADFQFAVPGDFYAGSYGSAVFLLDAAYSNWVRPGSRINIYVNGNIATSQPLSAVNGAILSQLPVDVTMRHFRPGLNDVAIEAILETEQDAACLPGATADDTPRFALFDTSRFEMPDFARVGQQPNLDAFAGVGYPYGLSLEPVALVMERDDASGLSAAANLIARMALSAGRSVPLTFVSSPDAARGRDAIFLGPITGVAPGVLTQVGVDESSRTAWTALPDGTARPGGTARIDADAWRQQMEPGGLRNWQNDLTNWFRQTFGITGDMLRFAPTEEVGFIPPQSAVLLVAQGKNPAGNGVWTLFTAPDSTRLAQGMSAVSRQETWQGISGHLSTLDASYATIVSHPATAVSFVETRPGTFNNYRLIIANWLSANILSYSLLLVVACVLLGMMTSALLSRLGRGR